MDWNGERSVRLEPDDIEAIAERVTALLHDQLQQLPAGLVDAVRFAQALGADSTVEAIAGRLAELLAEQMPRTQYIDTATVARMLGASEEWVRNHAGELGAVRLGDGPKGVLRFDAARVREALDRRRLPEPQRRRRNLPGPRRRVRGVKLLPLPDSRGVS